jgi:hypothetical protein
MFLSINFSLTIESPSNGWIDLGSPLSAPHHTCSHSPKPINPVGGLDVFSLGVTREKQIRGLLVL